MQIDITVSVPDDGLHPLSADDLRVYLTQLCSDYVNKYRRALLSGVVDRDSLESGNLLLANVVTKSLGDSIQFAHPESKEFAENVLRCI